MRVSASIVIYNEKKDTLKKAIESFLAIDLEKELIIIDNSSKNILQEFCESFCDVKYIHNNVNLGFGVSHNLAFDKLSKKSDIHLVINPDVYFSADIKELILWANNKDNISLVVPKVFFPNENYQNTIRKIPNLITMLKRKLDIKSDEFQEQEFSEVKEIPFAHGCFYIFKSDIYKKLSGFDERFFMYMEDVDIFIRAKVYGKTIINPNFKIYHEHRRGSSSNMRLFLYHVKSIIQFFFKYPRLIF